MNAEPRPDPAAARPIALELRDIAVGRRLCGVDAVVPEGSWFALLGPNGAGKTTLIKTVAGLLPFSGEVRIGGMSTGGLPRRRLARQVAYVAQRPRIPPQMSVADYVLLGRTPYIPYLGTETADDVAVAASVISRLGLDEFVSRPLGTLSGGEVQRVLLARALAQEAPLLLLDEPTTALDIGFQQQVLELVDELRAERRLTVVTSLHDLTLAGQFAERLLLLDGGRVVAQGDVADVLTEEIVRRHYGASVRIVADEAGGIHVLPTRRREGSA